VLEYPPFLPDLALADFFLHPLAKEHLADATIAMDSIKKAWEGVTTTIPELGFANPS